MFKRLLGGSDNASRPQAIPSVNPVDAQKLLSRANEPTALIDVRERWEYARGHAKGATNIPLSQLGHRASEVPTDRDVLVICQSGHRSMQAAKMLQRHGMTRITNVLGGTSLWHMHNLPME